LPIPALETQTKTVTPSSVEQTVTADDGYILSSVTVNPVTTQTKSAIPTTSAQTITPDSGKYLSSVSIDAISTQTKTQAAGTSNITVTPDSGKYLTSVTITPTPTETKTVSPSSSAQTVTPSSGKYLSQVTVNAISLKTQTVSQTITLNAGANTTKTFTFSNLTTVYGITKMQKTNGSVLITIFNGYPDAGTGTNALNIPSGGISGNTITQRFINNSDANNQSAVIAITAIGV